MEMTLEQKKARIRAMFPGARIRFAGMPQQWDVTETIEDVSPETAMEWIAASWERYQNGRNFYPTQIEKIKRYATEMREGRWSWSPEQESIDIKEGNISNGRHRLHAILLSGQTVQCTIKRLSKKEPKNGTCD